MPKPTKDQLIEQYIRDEYNPAGLGRLIKLLFAIGVLTFILTSSSCRARIYHYYKPLDQWSLLTVKGSHGGPIVHPDHTKSFKAHPEFYPFLWINPDIKGKGRKPKNGN